jgi:hypothetical protein
MEVQIAADLSLGSGDRYLVFFVVPSGFDKMSPVDDSRNPTRITVRR